MAALSSTLSDAPTRLLCRSADDGGAPSDSEATRVNAPSSPSLPSIATPPTSTPRIASTRYRRLAQLGAGGMSTVFLSRDEALQRDVAVKTAPSFLRTDSVITAAIAREAVIQSRLEHPAIPPVYDIGVDEHGSSFFTMRKIEGVSLATVLRRLHDGDASFVERFGQRRLLTAFSTVCAAVAFAHSKGVLHRDLKPSNVMFGEFGEVYLLDFGVARALVGPEEPWSQDAMVGTIGYVAPGQLRGQVVDERTDIYALGVVLFEILTHERLHDGEAHLVLGATLDGIDARIRARSAAREVPPALETLCLRATALVPADRIASARELHEGIERFLDGEQDIARRRALAEEYAKHASDALVSVTIRTAKGGPTISTVREGALEAANRALALEPMNPVATKVLAQLATMTRPGPDAEHSQREALLGLRRLLVRLAAVLFVVWLAGFGGATALGFRHWTFTAGAIVVALAVAAVLWMRSRTEATWGRIVGFTGGLVAVASTSALFGPFLLLPGYLACFSVIALASTLPASAGAQTEPRRLRTYFCVAILLTLLLPVVLESCGVLPPSMDFRDGALVLLPRAVHFPPFATTIFLVASNAVLVLLPAIIAARARDYALEIERRAFERASTLSQLVPQPARAAANR